MSKLKIKVTEGEIPEVKRILLIDGNGHMHRAYHSTVRWFGNIFYNAIWQFKRTLNMLIREYEPWEIIVLFDTHGGTYRNKLYAEYKAQRKETPKPLLIQLNKIKKELDKMEIKWKDKVGYEADDLIGIIANRIKNNYDEVLIVSQDKDLCQLVDEKVSILKYHKKKWEVWGTERVVEEFNVSPQKIPLWLALVGDKADNIEGVPGVGSKTASKLINTYNKKKELFACPQLKRHKKRILNNLKITKIQNNI